MSDDALCRCGHPESDHGLYPPHECFIARRWRYRGQECGCERFEVDAEIEMLNKAWEEIHRDNRW